MANLTFYIISEDGTPTGTTEIIDSDDIAYAQQIANNLTILGIRVGSAIEIWITNKTIQQTQVLLDTVLDGGKHVFVSIQPASMDNEALTYQIMSIAYRDIVVVDSSDMILQLNTTTQMLLSGGEVTTTNMNTKVVNDTVQVDFIYLNQTTVYNELPCSTKTCLVSVSRATPVGGTYTGLYDYQFYTSATTALFGYALYDYVVQFNGVLAGDELDLIIVDGVTHNINLGCATSQERSLIEANIIAYLISISCVWQSASVTSGDLQGTQLKISIMGCNAVFQTARATLSNSISTLSFTQTIP